MIRKYADISPDLFVRSNLAALKQGNGSVQACYDKFRTIIWQADIHPVRGAEAVWHLKQGLSDRILTAIAIYGDDDLDTVVMQAKRVDAAFRLEDVTSSTSPSSSKKPANSAGAKRHANTTSGDAKRAKNTNMDKAFIQMRLSERVCTKCRVPKDSHDANTLGERCTKPTVPARATVPRRAAVPQLSLGSIQSRESSKKGVPLEAWLPPVRRRL